MSFPYKAHQIIEILDKEKCLPPGDVLELGKMWKIDLGWEWEGELFS